MRASTAVLSIFVILGGSLPVAQASTANRPMAGIRSADTMAGIYSPVEKEGYRFSYNTRMIKPSYSPRNAVQEALSGELMAVGGDVTVRGLAVHFVGNYHPWDMYPITAHIIDGDHTYSSSEAVVDDQGSARVYFNEAFRLKEDQTAQVKVQAYELPRFDQTKFASLKFDYFMGDYVAHESKKMMMEEAMMMDEMAAPAPKKTSYLICKNGKCQVNPDWEGEARDSTLNQNRSRQNMYQLYQQGLRALREAMGK